MPEGDTIHRAAARLHAALAGDTLTEGRLDVPQHATADLAGAAMLAVVPRGKHLLMRMDFDGEALTLHSHLRMDGSWVLIARDQPGRRLPAHEVRARLRTPRWTALGHLLGALDLVRTADEHSVVGHLGPDLLDPSFDVDEARARLLADPNLAVAEALRDQRRVAGLGNELVTEICYLRGVTPWTPIGDTDVDALLHLSRRVIKANATRAVRSTTGDLRPGRTSYVYAREGRACRRCGTTVRARRQGRAPVERTSWWCPTCQRGPAPD